MTDNASFFKFEAAGSSNNGLKEWETMDPNNLISGNPIQRGHIYHENPNIGYMTGVWDCTEFVDQMGPYPVDEFMLFLEGELFLDVPNGKTVHIRAGDAFIIPKGFVCQWRQPGYVKKIFMIVDENISKAQNPSLERITVLNFDKQNINSDISNKDIQFLNAAGKMWVEVEQLCSLIQPSIKTTENKLVTILEGAIEIGSSDGTATFETGETFYIKKDSEISMKADVKTKMINVCYQAP